MNAATSTSSARGVRRGVVPAAAAVAWSLIALVGFAVVPFYSSTSASSSSGGATVTTTSEETIFEHEGLGVLGVLLVPVGLAFIGLVGAAFGVRPLTIAATGVLWGLCGLGMASIGLFYVPSAVLLVVAAARSETTTRGQTHRS